MPIDHAILKNELTTGAAYAAARAVGDDAAMLAQLRAPVAGFTVPAGVIPAYLVVNAIDPADWSNATAGEQDRIKTIIGAGTVDPSNVNVKNAFTKAFPAGSATRNALVALTTRPGSRLEQLFGVGTDATLSDISFALRGTR
jgi:hypothetical protein